MSAAVIRRNGKLPEAPYPRTPTYKRATIEVPEDAKVRVIKKTPLKTDWHIPTREEKKAHFNRSIATPKPKIIPPKAKKRILTAEELHTICMMYEAKATQRTIARTLHCDYKLVARTITQLIKEGRIQKRDGDYCRGIKRILTEKEIERIRTLYKSGISGRRIAHELHCSDHLVYMEIEIMKEEHRL